MYELTRAPVEAKKEDLVNADGVLEFPIYIGSSVIKLKRGKKAQHIYKNHDEEEETVENGTWALEGEIITLSFDDGSKETIEFKMVSYESGVYLKSVIGNRFYKKI